MRAALAVWRLPERGSAAASGSAAAWALHRLAVMFWRAALVVSVSSVAVLVVRALTETG